MGGVGGGAAAAPTLPHQPTMSSLNSSPLGNSPLQAMGSFGGSFRASPPQSDPHVMPPRSDPRATSPQGSVAARSRSPDTRARQGRESAGGGLLGGGGEGGKIESAKMGGGLGDAAVLGGGGGVDSSHKLESSKMGGGVGAAEGRGGLERTLSSNVPPITRLRIPFSRFLPRSSVHGGLMRSERKHGLST